MSFTQSKNFKHHEQLLAFNDSKQGFSFYIATHCTNLGPGLGGCRFLPYASEQDAIDDVLKLSYAMSYKHAIAKTPYGGAKAVFIGNPTAKTQATFKFIAKAVNQLQGQFIISLDSGFYESDLYQLAEYTDYITVPSKNQDLIANPSPATALGTFYGIQQAVKYKLNSDTLAGVKVAIQGVGNVGADLAKRLVNAGAIVVICDTNQENIASLTKQISVKVVATGDIYKQAVDVFAPCSLGGIISLENIKQLKAQVIAGCANNQLADEKLGDILLAKNILYVPDFVINSGGIINCHLLKIGGNFQQLNQYLLQIKTWLQEIFVKSSMDKMATNIIANTIAKTRINKND